MLQNDVRPRPVRRLGLRLWVAALVCLLLLGTGVTGLASVPPVYAVWLNGRHVGTGRDPESLRRALQAEVKRQLNREITLTAGEHRWTYRLRELGMTLSAAEVTAAFDEAAAQIAWWERLPHRRVEIRLSQPPAWDEVRLQEALGPIRAAVERAPVPAELRIEDRRPVIIPEVVGRSVELQPVLKALRSLGDAAHLEVPVTEQVPEVTEASLAAMRIKRLIAEWTTYYDPSIPRAENVEKAARAFHGLILKPGQILSYNDTVGPVNRENGWQPAPVIVGGELVPGVGGGVCQVATTFYGAALRANLDIVERHPHQLAVGYIAPSQDAAIAQGWEDLKLRNTTLGHMLIETEAEGGRVTFRIYGDLPEGQEVRIESRVIREQPFEEKEVVDPSLAPGTRVVKTWGSPGLVSEAYRLVYQDGKLVKRERLSRDSYLPTHQVVLVGPAP